MRQIGERDRCVPQDIGIQPVYTPRDLEEVVEGEWQGHILHAVLVRLDESSVGVLANLLTIALYLADIEDALLANAQLGSAF